MDTSKLLKITIKNSTDEEWHWMGYLSKEHLRILTTIADSLNTLSMTEAPDEN